MSVHSKVENDILSISFANPKFGNSFGLAEAQELTKILKTANKYKGIIFHSNTSSIFCSGGNLKDYAKLGVSPQGKKKGHAINLKITQALDALASLEIPTAVVVEGDCFGGGVELISAFDAVFGTPNAMFGLWQRKIGLSFGWGGAKRLLNRLSVACLRKLALETRNLSAFEACEIGLVDYVLPRAVIFERATAWIEKQSLLPKLPVKIIKNVSSENERKLFQSLWLNPEHRKILKKF